jgi:hypothetical protein
MLKSRSRMLVTLAAVALMGFAASVCAQVVPASPGTSPPRIEQAAVSVVANDAIVTAPVVAVAAVERAQLAAGMVKPAVPIERSPVAVMLMASVIALPGYAALMSASHVPVSNAHERLCPETLSISCPVGWN